MEKGFMKSVTKPNSAYIMNFQSIHFLLLYIWLAQGGWINILKLYFSAQPNCYVKALECLMLTFTKNYEQGGIAIMKKPKKKK